MAAVYKLSNIIGTWKIRLARSARAPTKPIQSLNIPHKDMSGMPWILQGVAFLNPIEINAMLLVNRVCFNLVTLTLILIIKNRFALGWGTE